jgi:acyl carrier protein
VPSGGGVASRCYHTDVTRAEIEQKLIEIVRREKNVPDDLLTASTPLADAGIDSLDALTILFGVEEEFRISIPDDRARAMKTLGDLVDIVESLVPTP